VYGRICCGDGHSSCAKDILDLIENHTDSGFGENGGTVICSSCGKPATIFRAYKLQEKGRTWECWIRQVVRIPSEIETYVPYMLFTTGSEAGKVSDGVMISYYKDTRKAGGRLKHGHGPGGPAVLGRDEIKRLIRYLVASKVISVSDVEQAIANTNA
jgi:hypothetical protein